MKREQLIALEEGSTELAALLDEQEMTAVSFQELTDAEAARVSEIAGVAPVYVLGRDFEDILVAWLADEDAERLDIYGALYVYDTGKVAQANQNHPPAFDSFGELVAS